VNVDGRIESGDCARGVDVVRWNWHTSKKSVVSNGTGMLECRDAA